jgi:hypothetical protein
MLGHANNLSPGWRKRRPQALATRLIASVVLRVKTMLDGP